LLGAIDFDVPAEKPVAIVQPSDAVNVAGTALAFAGAVTPNESVQVVKSGIAEIDALMNML
jgi:hypothetical protein